MADQRYRVRRGDYRYGDLCPDCPNRKTKQAARCRPCYAASRRVRRDRVQTPRFRCPDCGGPMWAPYGVCRRCWIDHGDKAQSADHPWRRRRIAA